MILQIFLLASAVAAAPTDINSLDFVDPNPSYSVAWEVKNEPTYDDKAHKEVLQDGTVEGQYSYLRPDGKMQVVTYRANDQIGFVVNVEVQDVMQPFGTAGRPSSAGIAENSGRSFASAGAAGSFGSGKSFGSSSSNSHSSRGKSLSASQSSSLNNINSGTATHRARTSAVQAVSVPVVPTTFSRQSSLTQQNVLTPAVVVQRIPVQRRPSFGQTSSQNGFRQLTSAQPAFRPIPAAQSDFRRTPTRRPSPQTTTTTLPPPPPPPTTTTTAPPPPPPPPPPPAPTRQRSSSANRGKSFTGSSSSSSQFRPVSQGTGVAHVTFNSPTHQYSYPLVVNN